MADDPGFDVRKLCRQARSASLATTVDGGQPFATLVTPAWTPDFSALLLLSDLSEHTRHLRADPRCALLVSGPAETANPQTAPRVTVTGLAAVADDQALKARYLAIHPYAALYADFGDFHLWRIRPMGALFVGGFARAVRIRRDGLLPDPGPVAAVAAAEAAIVTHCNNDHPGALARIAGDGGIWRMVAADTDGTDLAGPERVTRFHWSAPVTDPAAVRAELVRMARAADGGPADGTVTSR